MKTPSKTGTQSIERTLEILKRVSSQNTAGISLAEIARQSNLNTSTAHRILKYLVKEGLLMQKGPQHLYFLGVLAYELGLISREHFNLEALCLPTLKRLAETTEDAVFLTIRNGSDSVILQRVDGPYSIKTLTQLTGVRRPLGTTTGGVALLASLPASEHEKILSNCAYRYHGYGKIPEKALKKVLEQSITLGYALNENDFIPGVTGIGAAIPNSIGVGYAALSVVARSDRLNEKRRNEVLEIIKFESNKLAKLLTDSSLK